MTTKHTSISVIGMGKLGAPLAACFAAKGFSVVAVDADPRKLDALRSGHAPVYEPGLEELIHANRERLRATESTEEAVAATSITFIVVPTPSEPGGGFSLRHVLPTCEAIGRALHAKKDFHLVCVTSTVMPDSTGNAIQHLLERVSGKKCGVGFGLCYSPEFIALGTVIRDFLNPDFILIGESDSRSGDILEQLYRKVCDNSPAVKRMNFVNAEIAKLSVNTYITTKISFANMLARICERIPGADAASVSAAIGLDSRIGRKYLNGAISYGGPCFPRDNLALAALARHVGTTADIAEATDRFNRSQVEWLAGLAQQKLSTGGTIGILGLSYKPNTDVVDEAVGLSLARILAHRGVSVLAFDPAARAACLRAGSPLVRLATSAQECIAQSDVVIVTTPWQQFAEIPAKLWARSSPPRIVVDCWRALDHLRATAGVHYICLGSGGSLD